MRGRKASKQKAQQIADYCFGYHKEWCFMLWFRVRVSPIRRVQQPVEMWIAAGTGSLAASLDAQLLTHNTCARIMC